MRCSNQVRCNRKAAIGTVLFALLWLAAPARAQQGTWAEQGDAGDLTKTNTPPFNGGNKPGDVDLTNAQEPAGSTILMLDKITGTYAAGDSADVYKIRIPDTTQFSATTSQLSPGDVPWDTLLTLFDSSGHGLAQNDETTPGSRHSTLPLGMDFSKASNALGDNVYYLAISRTGVNPEFINFIPATGTFINLKLFAPNPPSQNTVGAPFDAVRTPSVNMQDKPVNTWDSSNATAQSYTITLTGADFFIDIPNVPPVFVSPVAFAPAPAAVGQTINFEAFASDLDLDPLTYTWDWGDGSPPENTGTASTASHGYPAEGSYNGTVSVSDGSFTVNAFFTVVVGVPIAFRRMSGNAFFAVAGLDSWYMRGTLALPPGLLLKGALVTVDAGGAVRAGTLNRRGLFRSLDRKVFIRINQRRGRFVVMFRNENLLSDWTDEGVIDGSFVNAPLAFFVRITVDDGVAPAVFASVVNARYSVVRRLRRGAGVAGQIRAP